MRPQIFDFTSCYRSNFCVMLQQSYYDSFLVSSHFMSDNSGAVSLCCKVKTLTLLTSDFYIILLAFYKKKWIHMDVYIYVWIYTRVCVSVR